jgi:hypothetical protein
LTHEEALTKAWITAENTLADCLLSNGKWTRLITPRSELKAKEPLTAEYYQNLHDNNIHYKNNNWLFEYRDIISNTGANTILELGTGNGMFSRAIAEKIPKVIAMDWAISPQLSDLPKNIRFVNQDITRGNYPLADLACSADVLEHFAPDDLHAVVKAAFAAANKQFHVIACYDDGHSHLTVMPPAGWLALFRSFDHACHIDRLEVRRNDPHQVVCAISNL